MKFLTMLAVLACAGLLNGCGGSDEAATRDSGATADAAPVVSPFVPQAIEGVINSMVNAVAAAKLASSAKPPIAVLLKDLTDFWAPVVIGANRMSTRLVCPSVVQAPLILDPVNTTADQASALQNQYVQSYLAGAQYRGMAYAPIVSDDTTTSYVNQFVDQRGPVVTIDSDAESSKRSYLIATANYQAGYTAATTLAQALQANDTIAVFGTTITAWTSGIERAQGAEDGATAAGLRVAPRINPTWGADQDLANLKTALLDLQLNIKGLLCVYSDANLCAQAAEQVVGVPGAIKIVGFDMTTDTKTYFDKGYFYGVAVQRQYYMGELGVLVPYSIDVLGAAVTNQLLQPLLINGTFIDTGIDVITPTNYSDYMNFLSTLGINA
jgi:ribose transport system substrate-binding protein